MPENSIIRMQTEIPKDKFEGFVLAGGKSSRMGTSKAFLKIGNETFIERAVKTLTPVCKGRVKIILNQNQSALDFSDFDYVRDIFLERGALGGIHAALSNSKFEWAIMLSCDLPLATTGSLTRLSNLALTLPDNIAAVVPIQSDGKIQPLFALYRSDLCLPKSQELLQKQMSVSVRKFLEIIPAFYVDIKKMQLIDETEFFNVNRPEDYQLLLRKHF